MYIKNYHNNKISPLINSQNQFQIELIKIQKNDYNTKMWVKINDQIFRIIILDEKYRTKFFVFDSFNNYNVFEIFYDFEEDNGGNDKQKINIMEIQGYWYLMAPLSGKIEKINVLEDKLKNAEEELETLNNAEEIKANLVVATNILSEGEINTLHQF
ncbi:MAG: hypothetical protein ACK4ZM_00855, partial [bacterium]